MSIPESLRAFGFTLGLSRRYVHCIYRTAKIRYIAFHLSSFVNDSFFRAYICREDTYIYPPFLYI